MKFCNAHNCNTPVFGKGYCRNHQYMREDFDRRSIVQRGIDKHKEQQKTKQRKPGWFDETVIEENRYALPKSFTAPKWMQDEANDVVKQENPFEGRGELGKWFMERRKDMSGICMHCSGKTMKDDDAKFHYSICHLFEKSHFPSIATHPENFIELCYYNRSCHKNFDDKTLPILSLNCFDEVVRKFCILYPLMTKEEKRRVPVVLLPYLEVEK